MFIEPPPKDEKKLYTWLLKLHERLIQDDLKGSATWNPANLDSDDTNPGDHADSQEVTVTGAAVGDYAIASFSSDVLDTQLDAQVTAANTVTCVLTNATNSAKNAGACRSTNNRPDTSGHL